MKKQIKPYTVIEWEDFQLIKFWGNYYIEEETQIMKLKKINLNRSTYYILYKRFRSARLLRFTKSNSRVAWNNTRTSQ